MNDTIRISKEETRQILYLNKQNKELLENPQTVTPHAIDILGITKPGKEENTLKAVFLLRSVPNDRAKSVGTTASNYIRVMIYPEMVDVPQKVNGKKANKAPGKPVPFNVFESGRPDLYAMLKKDILAKEYDITSEDTDEIPTATMQRVFWGKIITINVPPYKLMNRIDGELKAFEGPRLDRYTDKYKREGNTSTHYTFFVDSDVFDKGQLESFILTLMEDRISPFIVNKKHTLSLISEMKIVKDDEKTNPDTTKEIKDDYSEEDMENDIKKEKEVV